MRSVRSWSAARPRWSGAAWVAVWVAVLVPEALEVGRPAALAWLLAGAAPLAARHRRPVVVLAVVLAVSTATHVLLPAPNTFPVVLALVAVHGVALHVRGWVLWTCVATVAVQFLLVVALSFAGSPDGPDGQTVPLWGGLALAGSLLSAAVLLGVSTRSRRERLAVLEQRARQLEAERELGTRLAVAAERSRIAGEMHDIVAHSLTVMITLTDGLAARASAGSWRPSDPEALRAVSATGRQALGEMRRLLGLLGDDAPEELERRAPLPGTEDLGALVDQVRAAGLPVVVTREGDLPGLSAGAGLTVYRIVQEALTNTLKHAGPGASATVRLRAVGRRVEVEVADDGLGQQGGAAGVPPPVPSGHGLRGMAERVASYGGALEAGPRRPRGWRVRAVLDTGASDSGAAQPMAGAAR